MRSRRGLAVYFFLLLSSGFAHAETAEASLRVASSEAVFLDVARQIGGSRVIGEIVGGVGSATQRPQILIYDGGAGDHWIDGALPKIHAETVIEARSLASNVEGPSWYDLGAMASLSEALEKELARAAPRAAGAIASRRDDFLRAIGDLKLKAKSIVDDYRGSSVLLTDARFEPFCRSLGLKVVAVAAREGRDADAAEAIASRKGILLIYNVEAAQGLGSLKALADDNGLPLVGLRLTLPRGLSYQQWIGREINLIRGALNEAAP